jgi:hypothetical protein
VRPAYSCLLWLSCALRLQHDIAVVVSKQPDLCASVLYGLCPRTPLITPLRCSHASCTPIWCTGALAIGLIAGALSTAGYQYLGPALESKIGLRDTCGVHNLHGLPGILGGLAATVATVVTASKSGHVMHHGSRCVGRSWGRVFCCVLEYTPASVAR